MATKIYYKEVPNADDPDDLDPVLIDTLFLPKKVPGDKVSKDKETDILEISVDLSNMFELANGSTLPSASSIGVEKTYIYVEDKGSFRIGPAVKDVSRTGVQVFSAGGAYTTNPNVSITIPANRRDRWNFYKCRATYGGYTTWASGGLIPPDTASYTVRSPQVAGAEYLTAYISVDLHDVVLADPDENLPEGFADLSDVFTGKGEDISEWWKPLLYLSGGNYRVYYYDDDGGGNFDYNVQGLPKGEFRYNVIGGVWYHSDFMPRHWIGPTTKAKGATSVNFRISAPGHAYVFGMAPAF